MLQDNATASTRSQWQWFMCEEKLVRIDPPSGSRGSSEANLEAGQVAIDNSLVAQEIDLRSWQYSRYCSMVKTKFILLKTLVRDC